MSEQSTVNDLDAKLREAREQTERLWQEFLKAEEDAKPLLEHIQQKRSAWYAMDQRVTVLETIKKEGLQ